jgi:two-component system chemotaxis response regulator CheY
VDAKTKTKRVLVVDDSRIMRNIIKNIFNDMRMPVEFQEAANGKDALRFLRKLKIDMVLLDWNMPEINGLEFLKMVRAQKEFAKLPIIMITSESARYNVIEALKAGATDYLIKPLKERTFMEKMWKIMF